MPTQLSSTLITEVSSKMGTYIPDLVQRKLNLHPGDKLRWKIRSGEIVEVKKYLTGLEILKQMAKGEYADSENLHDTSSVKKNSL